MVLSRLGELFSSNGDAGAGRRPPQQPLPAPTGRLENCQPCRYIGGGGLTALGVYVLAKANGLTPAVGGAVGGGGGGAGGARKLFTREAGPRNLAANLLGCLIMAIGVARLLDYQMPADAPPGDT